MDHLEEACWNPHFETLAAWHVTALLSRSMGTKTTFICDCCHRETDSNFGWAHVHINGVSDGRQLMPDDDRDFCEICWSPLQTLMKKVQDEALGAKRNSSGKV